jgi:hypothetical protein
MKTIVLGMFLAGVSTSAFASCQSQLNEINRLTNYINQNSGSMGICQMARQSADLYWKAANYAEACLNDGAQAGQYRDAAQQAEATANASCS